MVDYCLKAAGIKTIRWDAEANPTVEQIRRIMLPSINKTMPRSDAAALTVFGLEPSSQAATRLGSAGQGAPDTVLLMRQSDPEPSGMKDLGIAMLEQLTPDKVLRTHYPHIWQRICTFAVEPKHLKKYLLSLSMQDRAEKRAGFSLEALKEIADIQILNDRFLVDGVTTWKAGFHNP